MGLFGKIGVGLKKTRDSLMQSVNAMLHSFTRIDDDLFEELEEILVMGDVGTTTASHICDRLRAAVKEQGITDPSAIRGLLKDIVAQMLDGGQQLHMATKPSVILVIGVNGVGKTTTIGKMAARLKAEGKKVILGAAVYLVSQTVQRLSRGRLRCAIRYRNVYLYIGFALLVGNAVVWNILWHIFGITM